MTLTVEPLHATNAETPATLENAVLIDLRGQVKQLLAETPTDTEVSRFIRKALESVYERLSLSATVRDNARQAHEVEQRAAKYRRGSAAHRELTKAARDLRDGTL